MTENEVAKIIVDAAFSGLLESVYEAIMEYELDQLRACADQGWD